MADKSDLPSFQSYFWPAIESLRARGGSATIEELEDDVAANLHMTDELRAVPHGNGYRTQFEYELGWVRTYLKKAGLAANSERGVWSLTDGGESVSEAEVQLVPNRVRELDRAERGKRADRLAAESGEDQEPLSWGDHLLEKLLSIRPDAFERLCQRLLRESGFTRVEVTGRTGDGGIDGIGTLRVNLVSFHVLFQCKKWRGGVGAKEVRDFRGAMIGRADKGLIVTTGHFTADARREASRDGAPAIDLVDGEAVCGLLKDLRLGVHVAQVEQVSIVDSFFESI